MCTGYARLFQEAVQRMQSLGGQLIPIDMTSMDRAAHMLYEDAFLAERYSAIRTFLESGKVRRISGLIRSFHQAPCRGCDSVKASGKSICRLFSLCLCFYFSILK